MQTSSLRAGLFGIGLDAYWPQFAGLKERLEGYVARVTQKLARPGVEVVNLGLVDNPDRAFAAGREFREFVQRWNSHGPAHHCAVGVGHLADRLEKLGAILGIETIRAV